MRQTVTSDKAVENPSAFLLCSQIIDTRSYEASAADQGLGYQTGHKPKASIGSTWGKDLLSLIHISIVGPMGRFSIRYLPD